MAQHFGDRDHIYSLRNQHRRCRMPECMGVDVRQVLPLTELCQPPGNGVRPNGTAIGLREHIIRLHPPITVGQLQFHLRNPIAPQQSKGLIRKRNIALIACLGCRFIDTDFRGVEQCRVDHQTPLLESFLCATWLSSLSWLLKRLFAFLLQPEHFAVASVRAIEAYPKLLSHNE